MIVPFTPEHVSSAAEIVAGVCRRQREAIPTLPRRLADPRAVAALLRDGGITGVACLRGATLAGFLAGWRVPLFGDLPGVFVPEWGHGAPDPDAYRDLYSAAARSWVGDGRTVHAVSVFAADTGTEGVWHDLGFGRVVMDRIRDLRPVGLSVGAIQVKRAARGDGAVLADLRRRTSAYLADPPVCRSGEYPESPEAIDGALNGDLGYAAWLGMVGGEVVGFVDTAPDADDAPEAVSDPGIVRLGGAFTVPEQRRHGVGAAVLDALFDWGRVRGYAACALDHETVNVAGSRFWEAMGFMPALVSVSRRV